MCITTLSHVPFSNAVLWHEIFSVLVLISNLKILADSYVDIICGTKERAQFNSQLLQSSVTPVPVHLIPASVYLELKLKMVFSSYHVDAGKQTRVLWKNIKCFQSVMWAFSATPLKSCFLGVRILLECCRAPLEPLQAAIKVSSARPILGLLWCSGPSPFSHTHGSDSCGLQST